MCNAVQYNAVMLYELVILYCTCTRSYGEIWAATDSQRLLTAHVTLGQNHKSISILNYDSDYSTFYDTCAVREV